MTPEQVKAKYGATHYIKANKHDSQTYYKSDNYGRVLYLSFLNEWEYSYHNDRPERIDELLNEWVEIK